MKCDWYAVSFDSIVSQHSTRTTGSLKLHPLTVFYCNQLADGSISYFTLFFCSVHAITFLAASNDYNDDNAEARIPTRRWRDHAFWYSENIYNIFTLFFSCTKFHKMSHAGKNLIIEHKYKVNVTTEVVAGRAYV